MPPVVPKRIQRRDEGILIVWDGAGHEALFPARALRLACPCAECVEERSGRPLLDPARVPEDVRPVTLGLVGAYGLKVQWSDGHSTGIYTFDRLLAICPCTRCGNPALVQERGRL
jgi:ATP-binding protein involved in chromosome partitioning